MLQVSVIVPTYREAQNIPQLTAQVGDALAGAGYRYEIIIADDESDDGTRQVCADLAKTPAGESLRLLSRTADRGLSPAVIDGIAVAGGEAVIVMDADLSHPPEKVPELAALLLNRDADFVVGSRYVAGGGMDEDWPWWRRINSLAATLPAKFLTPIADPMSGFFGLRREDMPPAKSLSPIGYKIGLELAVKGNFQRARIREVPIHFRDRALGESKMNLREQVNYLRHLRRLYHYRWPRRMEILQFLLVGSMGLIVDVTVYLLLCAIGLPHLWARMTSYWPAVTFNWFMNRIMTFKERPRTTPVTQWAKYAVLGVLVFAINSGIYAALTQKTVFFADNHLLALLVGVVVGTVFNFSLSNWVVFRRR